MRAWPTDTSTSTRPPPVALFAATSLAIGLSAGFGLGLWLLLARVWGVSMFGANWLVLVQVHGLLQLFGFAGLFAMGVALNALPRFRGAAPPRMALVWITYLGTLGGLALRSIAQPMPDLPARGSLLVLSGALLCVGTLAFSYAALRSLATGRNPHRPDELLIGAGICVLPIAALLVALEMAGSAPVLVDQGIDDRAVWVMLLGASARSSSACGLASPPALWPLCQRSLRCSSPARRFGSRVSSLSRSAWPRGHGCCWSVLRR